jgi:polar amino acid transport system substrate-binding protein
MAAIRLMVTLLAALAIGSVPMPRSGGADAAEPGIEIWLPLAPPNVRQEGDTLTGYLVELIKLAASRADVPIDHYEVVPYSRALKEISTSANYCNGLVARTAERETLFSWVAPTRRIIISAFTHAAMPDPPRTLDDLKKHEIAVQRGTLGDLTLTELGIPATRISETGHLVTMLKSDRVAVFVADYGTGMAVARDAAVELAELMQLTEKVGYFACSPMLDPEVARRLGDAFKDIFANGLDRPLAKDEFDSAVYERIRPLPDTGLQN